MSTDDFTNVSQDVDNSSDHPQRLPDDLETTSDSSEETLPTLDLPIEPSLDEDSIEEEELEIMDDWLKGATANAQGDTHAPLEQEEQPDLEEEEWEENGEEDYEEQELEEEDDELEEPPYQPEEPPPAQDSMGAVLGRMMTKDNLEMMGHIAFDQTDLMKAKICGYLENQHYTDFRTSEEMRQIVIGNFKAFFKEANIKVPPSGYILLGSLAMWLAPLGIAGVKRYGMYLLPLIQSLATPKTATTSSAQAPSTKAHPNPDYNPNSPYAHLREYEQGRKFFRVHSSTGKYAYHPTNSSTYYTPQEGVETPSPEIMEWKDEGLKDKDIRALLYD